jgi:hypothetical protein
VRDREIDRESEREAANEATQIDKDKKNNRKSTIRLIVTKYWSLNTGNRYKYEPVPHLHYRPCSLHTQLVATIHTKLSSATS